MDLPREVSQSSDFCTLADRVANRDLLIGIFEKRSLQFNVVKK
jgi:hypothetical protein